MSEIITRAQWGARYGRGHETNGAKPRFVVHHDGNDRLTESSDLEDEAALVRLIEHYHVNGEPGVPGLTRANPRVGYTFFVMPFSGRIFEGTGYGYIGAHTQGLNSSAYAVCLPMNGGRSTPSQAAIDAVHWLRRRGVELGHLSPKHILSGHQDHNKPSCPGKYVYDAIVRRAPVPVFTPTIREIVAAHPSLRRGKGGLLARPAERDAVLALQRTLVEWEAIEPRHVTGYFGDITDAAVRRFQRRKGLVEDGIVGARTWAALGQ